MEMTLDDIRTNKPLFEFCKKIWCYKKALECDARYLFMVTLISSDRLLSKEDCINSLNTINFILDNIDLFDFNEVLKKEVTKFLKDGLKIVKRDLKEFKDKE